MVFPEIGAIHTGLVPLKILGFRTLKISCSFEYFPKVLEEDQLYF